MGLEKCLENGDSQQICAKKFCNTVPGTSIQNYPLLSVNKGREHRNNTVVGNNQPAVICTHMAGHGSKAKKALIAFL